MSIKKFRFVSPGVFINEIDNSQLPKTAGPIGPVVIGRTQRGPGMRPVQVDSFSEFIEIFGNPVPGGQGGDVWRDGNYTAPTYAAYAAQAWLRNATPCTVVRLLGTHNSERNSIGGTDAGWNIPDVSGSEHGGAFGLFIAKNGEEGDAALAAVIYVKDGDIGLVGEGVANSTDATDGVSDWCTGQWVKSQSGDYGFKIRVGGSSKSFNFSPGSKKFIRNILNTNPTLTNTEITSNKLQETYFLGETFETHLDAVVDDAKDKGQAMGILLALDSPNNTFDKNLMNLEAQPSTTSWIFSQHTGDFDEHKINPDTGAYSTDVTNLFRLVGLDDGAWSSSNLKVSIADIKASNTDGDYGSFTVVLRQVTDSDNSPKYVERFSNCNLNPNSGDYIGRKIGDMKTEWDYAESRYRTTGQYPNASRFIRVEINPDVDAGATDPSLLPFGFYGPASPRAILLPADSNATITSKSITGTGDTTEIGITVISNNKSSLAGSAPYCDTTSAVTLVFPAVQARAKSSIGGLSNGTQAYFGVTSNKQASSTFDRAYVDSVKPYSQAHAGGTVKHDGTDICAIPAIQSAGIFTTDSFVTAPANTDEAAGDYYDNGIVPAFTLDDLVMDDVSDGSTNSKSQQHVSWKPGARYAGASISVRGTEQTEYDAITGGTDTKPGTHKDVLEHGYDKFTLPLMGGFDGLDITEKEPFRNTVLSDESETTHYAYNSVKRAIDAVADPEVVEMNLAVIPGCTNSGLTSHLVNTCERRADALAIIDLDGDYTPNTEGQADEKDRLPVVKDAVKNLEDLGISSSYGCAYFPWVQIRDTISDSVLWSPPSVVALGTMASSQRKTEVWFAPAGFNRGGLTEGSAGVPVTQVRARLTSKDRDKLYEANINPIASFPSEGIVIFGQKTLQVNKSALDRINVRRLLIYLKKEISTISAGLLFDNNVPATWGRFNSQVTPFLASVKTRFGLSEFKVVLDETTTTPDLIDRNIMYAKIFLKPARAIEFIAIDFVITRTGASFDD